MTDSYNYGIRKWIVALVVLVILLGILIIWGPSFQTKKAGVEVTPFEIPGVPGTVASVDLTNRSFIMEQTRFVEGGEPAIQTDNYIIFWNDKTLFFDYASPADAEQDLIRETQPGTLGPNKNVIVTQREKAGNVLTALEVRIFPGSAQAAIVE